MVIGIEGTFKNRNQASALLGALAVYGYAKSQQRTLILQFTNKNDEAVENILIGQTIRNQSLIEDAAIPDVSIGMDPLVARTSNYDKKAFSEMTKALVTTKKTNLFDVAYMSRKESFEEELGNRDQDVAERTGFGVINNLLSAANEAYDVVYVLIPNENKPDSIAKEIMHYVDKLIVCVGQGQRELYHTFENDNDRHMKEIVVATDFDFGSTYNSKMMAKLYGKNTVFGLIHNVGFKDAVIDGELLSWIAKNIKCPVYDKAYDCIHNIELLYNSLMGISKKKSKYDDEEQYLIEQPNDLAVTWGPINESVVVRIEKVKDGLFKTKTVESVVVVPEADMAEVENIEE